MSDDEDADWSYPIYRSVQYCTVLFSIYIYLIVDPSWCVQCSIIRYSMVQYTCRFYRNQLALQYSVLSQYSIYSTAQYYCAVHTGLTGLDWVCNYLS